MRPGQGLGLAEEGEPPPILAQRMRGALPGEAEIDSQLHVSRLWEMHEGLQGLIEYSYRLAERRAVAALAPACRP